MVSRPLVLVLVAVVTHKQPPLVLQVAQVQAGLLIEPLVLLVRLLRQQCMAAARSCLAIGVEALVGRYRLRVQQQQRRRLMQHQMLERGQVQNLSAKGADISSNLVKLMLGVLLGTVQTALAIITTIALRSLLRPISAFLEEQALTLLFLSARPHK